MPVSGKRSRMSLCRLGSEATFTSDIELDLKTLHHSPSHAALAGTAWTPHRMQISLSRVCSWSANWTRM